VWHALKSQRNQPPAWPRGWTARWPAAKRRNWPPAFEESLALIEQANAALLTLEADPDDREAINALFRSVHSIKGAAGLFDLPALIHLVHAGEDLLGAVRDGKLRVNAAMADELLAGLDYVTRWIGMFQAHGALPPEKMDIARRFAAAYRARLEATCRSHARSGSRKRCRNQACATRWAEAARHAGGRHGRRERGIHPRRAASSAAKIRCAWPWQRRGWPGSTSPRARPGRSGRGSIPMPATCASA
jgi:chemotaxis protein histidine kinase CheA